MSDENITPSLRKIYICRNGDCIDSDAAMEVYELLLEWIRSHGYDDYDSPKRIKCLLTGCLDVCDNGPVITIQPDQVTYWKVSPENLARICQQHLVEGQVLEDLLAVHKTK